MKTLIKGIAATYISLVVFDSITTFWAVSIGFREVNPLLHPLTHTYWLFPVMILPAVIIGVLVIKFAGRIQKVFAVMIMSSLTIWIVFLVLAIIHNSRLISVFA